jgi:hypothetical protein
VTAVSSSQKELRSGYLIRFDEEQRTDFLKSGTDITRGFSDAFSENDWQLKEWEVCGLLFEPNFITHWALARRGKRVATSKARVQFSYIVKTRISVSAVEQRLGAQLRNHLVRARSGVGGRVPEGTWSGLKKALGQLDPDSLAALERLEALRDQSHEKITLPGYEIVAEQRDAVGISLDAFDTTGNLRRETLKGWATPPSETLSSFLDGLAGIRTIEDQLIARDAVAFPGTQTVRHTVVGAVFGLAGQKLEVFNVNRNAVETSLGVDLLYWNEYFDAWTLIQYKAMERANSGDREEPIYRPDAEFDNALKKMSEFRKKWPDGWRPPTQAIQYRLCGDGFYFKLCSRVQLEILSEALLPGMYLPRQFISAALESSETRGPQGGRLITFENPGRHINNTVFANLVRDGWIGTRGVSSPTIANIMREALEADRALVIARARPRQAAPNLRETMGTLGIPSAE